MVSVEEKNMSYAEVSEMREGFLRRQVTGTVLGLSEVFKVNLTVYLLIFFFTFKLRTAKTTQLRQICSLKYHS